MDTDSDSCRVFRSLVGYSQRSGRFEAHLLRMNPANSNSAIKRLLYSNADCHTHPGGYRPHTMFPHFSRHLADCSVFRVLPAGFKLITKTLRLLIDALRTTLEWWIICLHILDD